jgi:isopenicillin-N epimerase
MMNRRKALTTAASTALFALAHPVSSEAATPLPDSGLFQTNPEAYWKRIRSEQFLLPDWRVYLNNGSLGVPPKPVVNAVSEALTRGASLITDEYPRWGYETLDAHRTEYAEFVGCKKDELAFMHNATEGMSTIAGGLDLKAADEVLITDQEHPSGRGPWLQQQARHGISVREVAIPLPPKSPDQLADLLISAIGPRTRVLSFSGITTTTGLILPIRQICDAARAKGVLTVVDGAHMTGQIPMRLSELNCDFFVGSPHKWMFAPPGCGLLYIREEMLDRLWPNTVTGNWDNKSLKAARFMMVGTNNRAVMEGMMEGLRFHKAIGSDRVYGRIHQLARKVYEMAGDSPHVELLTPADDRMYGSLVTFRLKAKDTSAFTALCKKRRMWIIGGERLRVSTHIHTRPSDIDLLFSTIKETA